MDLPILGTIDVTPTGIFLFLAAVIAVAYFGHQLFGTGRAGRDAKEAGETSTLEAREGAADAPVVDDAGVDDARATDAGKPTAEIEKDERTAD